jgi:hypothetical protein
MGMPRTSYGLGTAELGETAEVGEPAEGDDEAVVVFTRPVLRVSCDSRVEVLLLCGIAVVRGKAKGGELVDDGWEWVGRLKRELDAWPEEDDGSSLDQ